MLFQMIMGPAFAPALLYVALGTGGVWPSDAPFERLAARGGGGGNGPLADENICSPPPRLFPRLHSATSPPPPPMRLRLLLYLHDE